MLYEALEELKLPDRKVVMLNGRTWIRSPLGEPARRLDSKRVIPNPSIQTKRLLSTKVHPLLKTGRSWYALAKSRCINLSTLTRICDHGMVTRIQVLCDTWRCAYCAQLKAWRFKKLIRDGIAILGECVLLTVTWNEGDERTEDMDWVSRRVERLITWIRGELGRPVQYVFVKERTRKGQLHLHMVVGPWNLKNATLTKTCVLGPFLYRNHAKTMTCCLEARWMALVGAYVCDAQQLVSSLGAAKYLAKYLVKTWTRDGGMPNDIPGRRWNCSRGWPRLSSKMALAGSYQHERLPDGRVEYQWIKGHDGKPDEKCPSCDATVVVLGHGLTDADGVVRGRPRLRLVDLPRLGARSYRSVSRRGVHGVYAARRKVAMDTLRAFSGRGGK